MKNKEIEELLNELKWYVDADNEPDYNGEYPPPLEWEQGQVKLLLSYIEQLENNRDKAIEYLEFIQMDKTDKYIPLRDYKEFGILMNILKGDGNDKNN